MTDLKIMATSNIRWIEFDEDAHNSAGAENRCTREFIEKALHEAGDLGDFEVASVTLHTTGQYQFGPPVYEVPGIPAPDKLVIMDLPIFCEVVVHVRETPEHVSHVTVWVPLAWNGRFLGTLGGGNRTNHWLGFPENFRSLTMPMALRNGFATASTDGANRDPRIADWGLKPGSSEVDWQLIENWVHRSTHGMTVIGKAVTKAIQGSAPLYSYLAGCSGGGRQALVEAQRYPDDYDGIWSSDPAINWTKFSPATIWPALVMKEYGVLAPAKLEAFRAAAIKACDGLDGLSDGIIGAFDPCVFDARKVIGESTEAGVISETDALVMNKIWEGPRTRDGAFLWYGLRPGVESWGNNITQAGMASTQEANGVREPVAFIIAEAYLRSWIKKDPDWNWKEMTFEDFERIFDFSVRELADLASDDPDLSAFRDHGGKLILSHGANDQVIFVDGSIDYYRRVLEAMGGEEPTKSFARFFVTEGDGHGACLTPGPGLTIADTMVALMRWVEEGQAPDDIVAKETDFATGQLLATRPAYAYPMVPQYRGAGDPKDASSFLPVHLSARHV